MASESRDDFESANYGMDDPFVRSHHQTSVMHTYVALYRSGDQVKRASDTSETLGSGHLKHP
jgi:hypothetical protein